MVISSTSNDAVQRDNPARPHDQPTRLTDRALGNLEKWIETRTRRERARLDALMAKSQTTTLTLPRHNEWWCSWRACTRRRGWW